MDARESSTLYVVGIGASAGGLEALERFFANVPLDSTLAFVVVQHLSPDFKSLMDEILARRTRLPIHAVADGMRVEGGNIYLIPPKKQLIIAGGRLLLREQERDHDVPLPIDVFFRSLAQDCGPRSVAVVLSGGGSDGSRGILDVHEAGGLVLVQDLESAQFDGMPKTARDAGVADHVLPPDQMPGVIAEHARRTSGVHGQRAGAHEERGMDAVYRMLEKEFGIDFTHYKPSTVTRRIERRLALSRADDLDEYVRRLRAEREELDVLYRDLLIGVTRFFRNEEAFQLLSERALPELLAARDPSAPLRLWVAGCATGEEVYSLAIVLHELMQRVGERPVKIFATDVHRASIESAMRGFYDEQTVASVSRERLERYFLPRGRGFQVTPEIRQMVVFAIHNVIKDAPFTRVDLISCRNMLIYLQPPVQQRVLQLFHFALNRGGVLFLGPSESPGSMISDFETIEKHWRLYRKRSDGRALLPSRGSARRHAHAAGAAVPAPELAPPRYATTQLLATYDALLEAFMPPSFLVNERGELAHVFAGASRFLKPRDGRQSHELLDLVHPELRAVLFGALARAHRQPEPIVFRGVRAGDDDELYEVTMRRVQGRGMALPNVLVSLAALQRPSSSASEPARALDLGQVSREQLASLEVELTYTKENLQAATEELETSNEELQAANEELLASNEELQSTNEELQSVNEELYSVNAEYQRKIADLTELGNDMENLLSSTDVGAIFLDHQLRIRKFTPQIAHSFNLMPQDLARPISAFSHTIEHPRLLDDLQRVLDTGERVEREVRHGQNQSSYLRILPYRAKGKTDGVVLTMIDVSGLRAAEDALFAERYLLNSLLATVPDAIYFRDARGKFIRANREMAKRLGLDDARDVVGKTGFELASHELALAVHEQDEIVLRTGQAQHYNLERRTLSNGSYEWDLVTRLPLRDGSDNVVGVIGIFRNVTEQKRAEEAIEEAVRRRDQFLAMLSHELRNPLGAVVAATALLKAAPAEGAKRDKLLQILERQSQQMARLLDDLLEVSRVTQDKIELRKRPVDLVAITRDAIDAARGMMEERGLTFTTRLEPSSLYVDGDPARLQQIQANLLHNAAKYTPRGGHVELALERVGDEAVITVRDDGMGISPQILPNVFELFVQNNRTLDRADGGLGVGLTLVRGLVRKHGGQVSAHSDGEGAGSEFVVRLPRGELPPPSEEAPPRRLPAVEARGGARERNDVEARGGARERNDVEARGGAREQNDVEARGGAREQNDVEACGCAHEHDAQAPARNLRIVIVEDNPDSRSMLCELLEFAGFSCRAADNGLAGLALLDELEPDLALVDIGLPGIDGLEFARRVRADPRHAHVMLIALTGYGQREDRERVHRAGFDRHLVKPVDPSLLIRLLDELHAEREGAQAS